MHVLRYLAATLMLASLISAQNISSTVKGTVHDPSGAVVPGAECKLTNTATAATFNVTSASDGSFIFLNVLAGKYVFTATAAGFKNFRLEDVLVTASEVHVLSDVTLALGSTGETITIVETAPPVQTASGERSDLVTGTQLQEVAVKGRDFVSYLSTVPGVIDTTGTRDSYVRNALGGIHINGGRDTQALMLIDGMPSLDAGNNGSPQEPNMDAIAEIRVLTSNYQAEFGRNGGGMVTVISKTGGPQFHGSAYEYYRHESLNANSFFNNRTNTAKSPYRYRTTGYSIGGPVVMPKGSWLKDKMYFFFSNEFIGARVDAGMKRQTTPTDLERKGDFSKSFDVNGGPNPIAIKDPTTGQSFPGNVIPASRINKLGQSMLNFLPAANYVDTNPGDRYRWNFKQIYSGGWPRHQELGRLDFNPFSNMSVFYRVVDDYDNRQSPWGNWVNGDINYLLTPVYWDRPGRSHTFHATNTISPTLVNEVLVGKAFNSVNVSPVDESKMLRSQMGNPPQLYTDKDPATANWLPGMAFGSVPVNPINSSLSPNNPEQLPNTSYVISDNVSKVWRSHQFKFGIYVEKNRKQQPSGANFRGAFNFQKDTNNPNDSGHAFANALLGNFDTYSEANSRPEGDYRFWDVEWYAQDSWRVTKKLTIEVGLRMYHMPPTEDVNHTISAFIPEFYSAATAPVLYRPAKNAAGQRVAQNPITGAFAPMALIGAFVPEVKNPVPAARTAGVDGFPGGLYTTPALAYGPRFGFAYDAFGNGKTAVRGGFGVFKDKVQGNLLYNISGAPPVTYTPTIYYGNLDTFTDAAGVLFPGNATQVFGDQKLTSVMNFNLGVQQQVKSMIIDASYVGMLSRHLWLQRNMNVLPVGARFDPANKDATNGNPLPDNFLRPYLGYGNITNQEFVGTSNYNSFQLSVRRRFYKGLMLNGSYTYSKSLGTGSGDNDGVTTYFPPRVRNYGPTNFDRRNALVINYVYDVPNLGTRMGVRPAKWVLDNWQLSGVTSFISGGPVTIGLSTVDGMDFTGATDNANRPDVVAAANLPKSERTFSRYFNTDAFIRPAKGTFGNESYNPVYGPGMNNWDLAITKKFPVFSESRTLNFRTELFNAFNHTQFSGMNTTPKFDASGKQIDTTFGQLTGARNPRQIQFSARFVF